MTSPALEIIERGNALEDLFEFDGSESSLANLGWPEIILRLQSHSCTTSGKELIGKLKPMGNQGNADWMLEEAFELLKYIQDGSDLTIRDFPNLQKALVKVEKDEVITGKSLREIAGFLEMTGNIKRILKRHKNALAHLAPIESALDELKKIRMKIELAIDVDGDVRETASPKLKKALSKARTARNRLTKKAEQLITRAGMEEVMQDNFYTLREDRIVIPVKSEMRSHVDGIVHASSQSGQTVFMEPVELIEPNNRLKVAQIEVEQETYRILAELSGMVAAESRNIKGSAKATTYIDFTRAKALLADKLGCERPQFSQDASVEMRSLRHPLLALQFPEDKVIPNDMHLDADTRVLVISGPNAGGKTVAMKSIGLAAAMARAGMLIPANKNCRLPFYAQIFADIGDEQDIALSLSSYSAHMLKLKEFLSKAGSDTLILLDELATSTDPTEGAALASAVLDAIVESGATAIVTTHFPSLKAMAQVTPGFKNASMEFDVNELKPTYKLLMGTAGRSAAFEIARRLGISEEIVEKARGKVESEKSRAEVAIEDIEEQLRAAERSRVEAERNLRELKRLRSDAEERALNLKAELQKLKRTKKQKLAKELEEAREEISKIIKGLRSAKSADVAVAFKKELKEIEDELAIPPETHREILPTPTDGFKPGDLVVLKNLDAEGEVKKLDKKKIVVRIGNVDMTMKPDDLGFLSRPVGARDGGKSKEPAPSRKAQINAPFRQLDSLSIDLRGMRADEALSSLEKYLDDASLGNADQIRIIHGHGTGALKKSVRDMLRTSKYIQSWSPEKEGLGGDGVTVVKMKP